MQNADQTRPDSIVTVCYEYTIEGERYGGRRTKAFVLNASAEEYTSALPKGTHLRVASNRNRSVSSSGVTLFTALQEQLGLRLESLKARVGVVMIDSVQKASEN